MMSMRTILLRLSFFNLTVKVLIEKSWTIYSIAVIHIILKNIIFRHVEYNELQHIPTLSEKNSNLQHL